MADTLAAALWLAERRDLRVFELDHPELPRCAGVRTAEHNPATCTDRGKHPCGAWSKQATTDREQITAMFAGTTRNIGIACGPSGLLVVDEDRLDAFTEYADSIGQTVPATFTVRTGKGRHFYFRAPDGLDLGNAEGGLKGRGINIRGRGGYVVGPASTHATGATYTPVDVDAEILPCPAWLVEALTSRSAPDAFASGGFDGLPEVIRGPRSNPDEPGERHEMLVRYACSLRARDLPPGEAEVLFRAAWQRCEQPPTCTTRLPWDEALAKLKDVYYRYPAGRSEEYRPTTPTVLDGPQNGDTGRLSPTRMIDGAAFILDTPVTVPRIWGRSDEVIWAEGESLIITGPPGVGKTTLTGQLVRARLGLVGSLLGFPVAATTKRVLYLAMDRPAQIARSLRRHFRDTERAVLADRLVVWKGPPPGDVARHTGTLVGLAQLAEADTIILDSLKDAALGLTDDEVGAAYNRARQLALNEGVQLVELRHVVKRGPSGAKPTTLADVYGSVWLTAGAGSVVLLWGAAGDPIVEWHHLKQPAAEVGPMQLIHDHDGGHTDVWRGTDLIAIAVASGSHGLTVRAAAVALFNTDKPTPAQIHKAARRLEQTRRRRAPGSSRQRPKARWREARKDLPRGRS